MQVISVVSSSNKVGKTFYSLHLARLISLFEKKVLVVDLDFHSQGLTRFLEAPVSKHDLTHALLEGRFEKKCKAILAHTFEKFGISVIPANRETVNFARYYPDEINPYPALVQNFQTLLKMAQAEGFDYVIFDTAAGHNLFAVFASVLSSSNIFIAEPDINNLTLTNSLRETLYVYKQTFIDKFAREGKLPAGFYPFFRRNAHRFLFINFCTNLPLPEFDYLKNFVEYTASPYENEVVSSYHQRRLLLNDEMVHNGICDYGKVNCFYVYNLLKSLRSLATAIGKNFFIAELNDRIILDSIQRSKQKREREATYYYQEEMKQNQRHISSLQASIDGLENSLAIAGKRYNELCSEIETLESKKNLYMHKIEVLETDKKKLQETHDSRLMRQENEYNQKIEDLLADIQKLNREIFKYKEELEQLDLEKKQLQLQWEEEKRQRTHEYNRGEEKIQNLEKQLSETSVNYRETAKALEEERSRHREVIDSKNKDITTRDGEIEELRNLIGEKSLTKIADLSENVKKYEAEIETLRQEIEALSLEKTEQVETLSREKTEQIEALNREKTEQIEALNQEKTEQIEALNREKTEKTGQLIKATELLRKIGVILNCKESEDIVAKTKKLAQAKENAGSLWKQASQIIEATLQIEPPENQEKIGEFEQALKTIKKQKDENITLTAQMAQKLNMEFSQEVVSRFIDALEMLELLKNRVEQHKSLDNIKLADIPDKLSSSLEQITSLTRRVGALSDRIRELEEKNNRLEQESSKMQENYQIMRDSYESELEELRGQNERIVKEIEGQQDKGTGWFSKKERH